MLIFSVKVGEKVIIDKGNIEVTLTDMGKNQVKLGFTAPKNISIDREEIYKRKQLNK